MIVIKIKDELLEHLPFTIIGAASGVIIAFIFYSILEPIAHTCFYILHPTHVVLSALATASMYHIHKRSNDKRIKNLLFIISIGYVGAIGVATISDSVIPYLGEVLLNMPHRRLHIGFIEKWWLINPLALLGIAFVYIRPSTKVSHLGHVLLSTWASIFHVIMAANTSISLLAYGAIFLFLIISVWLPCCVSDIIFPLLFINNKAQSKDKALL